MTRTPGTSEVWNERVALFIDMNNLYYAARTLNIRIDYDRLRQFVGRNRRLLRAFAYMGIDPNDAQAKSLVAYLKRYAGYKVIEKPLRRYDDGTVKANLDIELAIDMMTIAEHVDTIVLVSGDGDFVRLVETVQFKGVRVEVIGLEGSTATALIEASDGFTNLAEMIGDVQRIEPPGYQRRSPGDLPAVAYQNSRYGADRRPMSVGNDGGAHTGGQGYGAGMALNGDDTTHDDDALDHKDDSDR